MRTFSLLLSFAMLFSLLFPVSVSAEEIQIIDGISLQEEDFHEEVLDEPVLDEPVEVYLDEEATKQLNEIIAQAQSDFKTLTESEGNQTDGNTGRIDIGYSQVNSENINSGYFQTSGVQGQLVGNLIQPTSNSFGTHQHSTEGMLITTPTPTPDTLYEGEPLEDKGSKTKGKGNKGKKNEQKNNNNKNQGKKNDRLTYKELEKKLQKLGKYFSTKKIKKGKNSEPIIRYAWGGNKRPKIGKNGEPKEQGVLDCSSFVKYIYEVYLKKGLPRTTGAQYGDKNNKKLSNLKPNNLKPGDLLFTNNLGHVGIYIGDGLVLHNSSGRKRVVIDSLSNYKPQNGVRYNLTGKKS